MRGRRESLGTKLLARSKVHCVIYAVTSDVAHITLPGLFPLYSVVVQRSNYKSRGSEKAWERGYTQELDAT